MSTETPLCQLARHYGTDKGGAHYKMGDTCHNYTPAYYELFKHRREQVRWVLEIGVMHGHSLRMWRDFFPHAFIFGIDSNADCIFAEDRICCYRADQNNETELRRALGENPPQFDLIVDDGSHIEDHQVFSALVLLPYLADDGNYVIEDLYYDCQPQRVGNRIIGPFYWRTIPTGHGLGRAHCECGCGAGEQLLVLQKINNQHVNRL